MGCERCGELEGTLGESLDSLDAAEASFGDLASECEYHGVSPASLDRETLEATLDEVLEILERARRKASDAAWMHGRAAARLRKEAGL